MSDGLVTEKQTKNASASVIRKYTYTYNLKNQVTEENVYNDGSTLSYSNYYNYDNWGNIVYAKNAEGHEIFLSYANTSTSGFFVDNTGTVVQQFTNAFSGTVPSSVHTVLLGAAERQDETFVREVYITYDSEAHPTQSTNSFGNATTWLTFSGTFNEKTGSTSFPVDLTGHTIAGNGVLQITGAQSDDTYQESHSTNCGSPFSNCSWLQGNWSGKYFDAKWQRCFMNPPGCSDGWVSAGPFTHYPGTLGYQSYSTNPLLGQGGLYPSLNVTTNWKAYPAQVQYKFDSGNWTQITSNLKNATVGKTTTVAGGSHTLYFSESSSQNTKFSWTLYVPVDNTPDTYTTSMTYDSYGNVTSVTDAESNTTYFSYSAEYSHAYLTEMSVTVGSETITTKTTYDYYRGWVTSFQEPKGVKAGSAYDHMYTYDVLGRII